MSPEQQDELWKGVVDRINEDALQVSALCIMDYWTFDGYLAIRKYCEEHDIVLKKTLFPGIEFRLEAPTDHKLNTHVIFSDLISLEKLSLFLSHLRLGGAEGKPVSRTNLIEAARKYGNDKLKIHGCKPEDRDDDSRMLELALMTVEITRGSLQVALEDVGKENCLVMQPFDTHDGLAKLDWKSHPFSDVQLMQMADCYETRDQCHVDLMIGNGHPSKPSVAEDFLTAMGGFFKPALSGSDAHKLSEYGCFPNNRVTWLKATPTFEGLKQVCYEPTLRCYIGHQPEKVRHFAENATKYFASLEIEKIQGSTLDEHWFTNISLQLNPGLIAIIGHKGSGKSALADILALCANAHCQEMEFLTTTRFKGGNNKAKHFKATLTWADGTSTGHVLNDQSDLLQPERARYLPQKYIEALCNEISTGDDTKFEKELKKVIFSHVPQENRIGKASLDELIDFRSASQKKEIELVRSQLKTTNQEIEQLERTLSSEAVSALNAALKLKELELISHESTKPTPIAPPPNDNQSPEAVEAALQISKKQNELHELQLELANYQKTQIATSTRIATLDRLLGHISNFRSAYEAFIDQYQVEFIAGGFDLTQIVTITTNAQQIEQELADAKAKLKLLSENLSDVTPPSEELSDGHLSKESAENKSIAERIAAVQLDIEHLQANLNEPQLKYQEYVAAHSRWEQLKKDIIGDAETPGSIAHIKGQLNAIASVLPEKLVKLQNQRQEHVRAIHQGLLAIRNMFSELYQPVQDIATATTFTNDSLKAQFSAYLTSSRFSAEFLDFINKNRKGAFYGDDESRKAVQEYIEACDFETSDSVVQFVNGIRAALGNPAELSIESIQAQLKSKKTVANLYDFLYGLTYLEPRYTLRLGEKDISRLSPGEKGALLLVFYLLLDREDIPIIIDQPEQNLDNESVVRLLVECVRRARRRRQVVIVTHNPNLAVVCDADQVICCNIDKTDGHRISYLTGAIEESPINSCLVDVLEGTFPAFDNRRKKYRKQLKTHANF